jgi:hypothetical protein
MKTIPPILLAAALVGVGSITSANADNPAPNASGKEPDFTISRKVSLSVPDKTIEDSFRVSRRLCLR